MSKNNSKRIRRYAGPSLVLDALMMNARALIVTQIAQLSITQEMRFDQVAIPFPLYHRLVVLRKGLRIVLSRLHCVTIGYLYSMHSIPDIIKRMHGAEYILKECVNNILGDPAISSSDLSACPISDRSTPHRPPFLMGCPRCANEPQTVEELQDLEDQLEDIVRVCDAVDDGDLTRQITFEAHGDVAIELKHVINTMMNFGGHYFCYPELERTWYELASSVNHLAGTITNWLVRSIASVAKAIALGDLSKEIEAEVSGKFLDQRF
ncbi:hypothetical protein EV421DRAFT_1733516 [Armillaria borealis]|uniref:Uncharacterized protein n=1 Tax=Armillaria borealis TaxID=47425 RepID=A0AA39MVT1_9AGAR|nr:hypothetical protein EV421DRAFT_1733516 [Armillaria borealis]